MPTDSQLDANLRDRYARLVDERNAARRELEAARVWGEQARAWIGDAVALLYDLTSGEDLVHRKKLEIARDLVRRCPFIGASLFEQESEDASC